MAFMVPVMRKDFDIYKTGRSRRASECSKSSACSSRKVSESRSECPSLSTSPESDYLNAVSPSHRSQPIPLINRNTSRPQISRASSRNSQTSLIASPAKNNSSPPKSSSQSSLNKFHSRLVDKLRKSLRKARSTDRSWGNDLPSCESSLPLFGDSGELHFSDSVLNVKSKPPLPRGSLPANCTPTKGKSSTKYG